METFSTHLRGDDLVVEWRIADFSTLEFYGSWLWSPDFFYGGEKWRLCISPNGSPGRHSSGNVDVGLMKRFSGRSIRQLFAFALKTVNGDTINKQQETKDFNDENGFHPIVKLIPRSELFRRRTDLLPSDVLTVVCIMKSEGSSVCPHDQELHNDLKELFKSKKNWDIIIKVKNLTFQAHKLILTARSPVFASIFRHDMKENATGIVEIEDCEPSSFSDFLSYIYSGDSTLISQENVFDLFTAADKYQVLSLRAKCLDFMRENLSVDTFCETLTMAQRHSEAELMKLCIDYFKNNISRIIVTCQWQTFLAENPTETNELLVRAFVPNTN